MKQIDLIRDHESFRCQVVEHTSHFTVRDTKTGQECPLGDGVDTLSEVEGNSISPETDAFCEALAEALNADESETLEAYFREQFDMVNES